MKSLLSVKLFEIITPEFVAGLVLQAIEEAAG